MDRKAFDAKAKQIASFLKQEDNFVVVNHFDADGLSSGSIIIKALQRENKSFQIKTTKQIYHATIEEIKQLGEKIIFIDFGSGQLDLLQQSFSQFAVIDHHQTMPVEHDLHFNPLLFGFDGGFELSGAGAAYFIAKEMNKKNFDLSPLAIVGAVGDIQDMSGKLIGLNREILKEAEENKLILTEIDLRMFGRITRPLAQYLSFSSTPVIPFLTANEENCYKFLRNLGIELKVGEKWRTYSMLSLNEKQQLTSGLLTHLVEHGLSEEKARNLIGEVYTLLNEKTNSPLRDAKEFATLLNACGRNSRTEIGIQVCLGDRDIYYNQALSLLAEHRLLLRNSIEWVKKNGIKEFQNFYLFDARENIPESIVGIVAGMLYGSGIIEADKPIIAFANEANGGIKVSGRATQQLVENGINLGKSFKEIASELHEKSLGGGHKIAAGCLIQANEKELFLQKLEEKLSSSKI
ncbi:MAG: DHH family phosphoesterase [archaeon]|nr:DHH family phosphoesterase [archaeon]